MAKYIGGKQRLANQLIQMMPPHETYIEGFAGMASVYLAKPKAKINIVNDMNSNIINLFMVARDFPDELAKLVELTPYAQKQFDDWIELYFMQTDVYNKLPPLKRAIVFYYILQCAYNSEYVAHRNLQTFSTTTARSWASRPAVENLYAFSQFTKGTAFTNMDYKEVIRKYADANTFIYLDPPYTMAGDRAYYEHNFDWYHHKEMKACIQQTMKDTKAKFMVSYDDHPEILAMYKEDGFWTTIIKDVPSAASNPDEDGLRVTKNEAVITNYDPQFLGLFAKG